MDSPYYGMYMIFDNIVEIFDDGFWCTGVTIKTVYTADVDGVPDKFIEDDVVNQQLIVDVMAMLIADQSLIDHVNMLYYAKYIANELFMYNKIVSSSANNLRYKSVTIANFASLLDLNLLPNAYNLKIIKPDSFSAPISLKAINHDDVYSELVKLDVPYFYPMYRHEGVYVPLLQTIYDFNQHEMINASTIVDYKKFTTIVANQYVTKRLVGSYQKGLVFSSETMNFHYLLTTNDNKASYLELPWLAFQYELRNFSSICFNSEETITDYVTTTIVNFENVCKFKHSEWLNLSNFKPQMIEDLKQYYLHSTGSIITSEEILRKAVIEFIKFTFLKIYRIDSIVDGSGKTYEYLLHDDSIEILGPTQEYLINYTR
jgi:hypothetical protein